MKERLHHMLDLQDRLNRQIDPHWLSAGRAWYRAIWTEAAELLDHYGWKWWKAQPRDLEQIRLELIDIWHFGLSAELVRHQGNAETAAAALLDEMSASPTPEAEAIDFLNEVENIARHALTERRLAMAPFLALLAAAGSSFDDLYRIYVGKNVLNRFRQDHGYREGRYIKTWDGREDNEHLAELSAGLDTHGGTATFEKELYRQLLARYPGADGPAG